MAQPVEAEIQFTGLDEAQRKLRATRNELDGLNDEMQETQGEAQETGGDFDDMGGKGRVSFAAVSAAAAAATVAIVATKEAVEAVIESIAELERRNDIIARFSGNIGEASRQVGGLVTNLDLMTTQTLIENRRGLELTNRELASIAIAARTFSQESGEDFKETFDRITEAIATGATGALEDYGLVLEDTAGGPNAVAEEAVRRLSERFGDQQVKAESLTEATLVFKNALDNAVTTVSEGWNSVAPELASSLDILFEAFGELGAVISEVLGVSGDSLLQSAGENIATFIAATIRTFADWITQVRRAFAAAGEAISAFQVFYQEFSRVFAQTTEEVGERVSTSFSLLGQGILALIGGDPGLAVEKFQELIGTAFSGLDVDTSGLQMAGVELGAALGSSLIEGFQAFEPGTVVGNAVSNFAENTGDVVRERALRQIREGVQDAVEAGLGGSGSGDEEEENGGGGGGGNQDEGGITLSPESELVPDLSDTIDQLEEFRASWEAILDLRNSIQDIVDSGGPMDQFIQQIRELNAAQQEAGAGAIEFGDVVAANAERTANQITDMIGNQATSAVRTHVAAWIEGRESIGEAVFGIVQDILMGMAIESTVQAIFQTAHAIAAFAGGRYDEGVLYLTSAAEFAAVAALAGAGAAAVGAIGGGGGGSSGGGSGASGGGRDSRGQRPDRQERQRQEQPQGNVVININSPVPPAQMGRTADRWRRAAERRGLIR